MKKTKAAEKKKYWYRITIHYCPVCASEEIFKERQYTPRPEKWQDRNEFVEMYDWCNERSGL